jgi:hypothetical protein
MGKIGQHKIADIEPSCSRGEGNCPPPPKVVAVWTQQQGPSGPDQAQIRPSWPRSGLDQARLALLPHYCAKAAIAAVICLLASPTCTMSARCHATAANRHERRRRRLAPPKPTLAETARRRRGAPPPRRPRIGCAIAAAGRPRPLTRKHRRQPELPRELAALGREKPAAAAPHGLCPAALADGGKERREGGFTEGGG